MEFVVDEIVEASRVGLQIAIGTESPNGRPGLASELTPYAYRFAQRLEQLSDVIGYV